jgi:outer membrane receptor protein involved in Fe transport
MKTLFTRVLLTCCLMLSFVLSGIAQQATVKGIVTEATSGEALPATIRVLKDDGSLVTGAGADVITGEYMVKVDPGKYKLTISYIGLATQDFDIELAAGDTKEINAELKEEENLMKVVTVTGSKSGTQLAKNTVSVDIVKPTLVENTNATKVDDVVDKVPGVTVVEGQANIRGGAGWSYGAGSRVLILVDDLPFMSADAGLASWRDIPVENIDQIEVLKGAASALYGSSALNGIINIRTGYAKSKPETKISLFQTSFAKPRQRTMPQFFGPDTTFTVTGLDWWNQDNITATFDVQEGDSVRTVEDTTFAPRMLAGPNGYRKPIEFGASFAHRRKIGKFDITLGGNAFYQDSHLGGQYERKIRFNSNLRYRFTDSLHVGMNINVNYGTSASFFIWGNANFAGINPPFIDSLPYFTLAGTITESVVFRTNADPYVTFYDRLGNRHRVQTRIYYVDNQNGNNQSNTSLLSYLEYQYQRTFENLGNLKVVGGAVGQYSYATSQLYGNADYDVINAAGYLQLDKGFVKDDFGEDKLNFSVGARFEYNNIRSPDSIQVSLIQPRIKNPEPNSIGARPVFRAGVNYEATPFTFIRASWGQGYRYPTIAERYVTTLVGSGSSTLEIRANPQLEPETGFSAELGVKQGFMISKNWKGFADISFFWTEYQNMMEFTFGGGDTTAINNITLGGVITGASPIFFQSANIGDTRIRGAEFAIMGTGKIGPVDVNLLAGYTYLDPQFQDFNARQQLLSSNDSTNVLKYRNRHAVKFDIEGFFLKQNNLSVGFSANYLSKMEAIDAVFEDLIFSDDNLPFGQADAFGIGRYRQYVNAGESLNVSARIGYRHAFMDAEGEEKFALKLSLVGKNLLNQEYTIRPSLVAAPMNITVRLDVDF